MRALGTAGLVTAAVKLLRYAALHASSLLLWLASLFADYPFEAVPLVHGVAKPRVGCCHAVSLAGVCSSEMPPV